MDQHKNIYKYLFFEKKKNHSKQLKINKIKRWKAFQQILHQHKFYYKCFFVFPYNPKNKLNV